MQRTLDTYTDQYPSWPQVEDALDFTSGRGVITGWYRVTLKPGQWVVRVYYEPFDDAEHFAYESARDQALGEGIKR